MKRFHSRILSTVLAAVLAISTVCAAPAIPQVQAQETNSGYEIYPNPHEVSYQEGEYAISSDVNVVLEEGIDEATENRLGEILENQGITMTQTDGKVEGKTNIFVGTYESGLAADQYVQENYDIDAALFEHSGSHYLISNNNEICVLGKDTDGAFYGLTSLKHIFNQLDDLNIRNFTIKDYADTEIRGFIEGYYGIPWSNENRMSLMEFGGEFKMTSYVFAPKDDPYHTSKWRELYPEKELAAVKEMVDVGNASKCKFVWTAHPFMGGFNSNDVEGEIAALLRKFDQLYEAGVRQFGVLGDDVGSLNRQIVIQVMNAVSDWANEKGDVYDSVFCPAGYNDAWQGNYSELNDYDAGFPDDVQIFWTGQAVCQPIEQKTLTNFRTKGRTEGQEPRRAPLFWLNWPVNDINMSRLVMGKGSQLHTDINIEDLAGAVTNPMQDAQASKVALFAVADYTWNIKGFDDDTSWADSFKYIDKDAAEELHTLAKHMSDPSPNNHGLVLAESEELKPLLDEFMAAYEAGNFDAEKAQNLIAEFEVIIAACEDFHKLSKNEELKKEILPFSNALKDLCEANIAFIKTAAALEEENADAAWANYAEASAELAASKNHDRITIGGTAKAIPASKWIRPFAEKLNTTLSAIVNTMLDETKVITSLITNRPNTPDGAFERLTDNNEATEAIWKSPNNAKVGDYIGLSYNKPIKVTDITFKMGQSGNMRDTFSGAKIQYTEDGKEWIDIEGTEYTDRRALVEVEGLDIQAKGIRLIATEDVSPIWLGCRDIIVNKGEVEEPDEGEVTKTIIKPSDWSIWGSDTEANLTDGDVSKGIWYDSGAADDTDAGEYLGMDLGKAVDLSKVTFAVGLTGGDKWEKYHLEYSVDGESWTTVKSYEGAASGQDVHEEDLMGIKARYVRIVNDQYKKCWVKFGEFDVELDISGGTKDYTYTNVEALKNLKAVHTLEKTHFVGKSGITLKPAEYLGLKLERIKDITAINVDLADGLTLQTSKNAVIWTDVTGDAYEDARYIRVINKTNADVTFDLTNFAVESYEVAPISVADTNVSFYGGNGLEAFDKNRTTETVLWSSQTKGVFVTYDLGQTIDLNSLALVSKDSAGDFPRHAKISVSEDGENWTEVMTIGNQDGPNEGEAEGTDNIMDVLPIHDVSSNLKKAEGLDLQTRYIKFEITRTKVGPDKWTRYTEIELNGGDLFLPTSNDPTITTDAGQSDGNLKDFMIDGELSTTFKPVADGAGSFTYYISEKTEQVGKVRILQSPAAVSGAEVTAEVVKKEGGKAETVVLGALDKSLNEFDTNAYANVLSVTVTWTEGNVPTIHEIIASMLKVPVTPEEPEDGIYTAYVDGEAVAEGEYNTKVELHADAEKDGKLFVCWMAGEAEGEEKTVVSMNKDYTFYLANDVYLTAVYETTEEIKATASLINTIKMPANDGKINARFVGQLALPEGAKLLDAGLVWSSKETPAELTVDADGVKVTHITKINTANQFSVTIKGMPTGKFVRGVIFAEVELPDGTTTIYSGEARITN